MDLFVLLCRYVHFAICGDYEVANEQLPSEVNGNDANWTVNCLELEPGISEKQLGRQAGGCCDRIASNTLVGNIDGRRVMR